MGDFMSVAGVDVHKDSISITMLFQEGGKWKQEYFESQTFSQDLIIAGKKIKSKKITEVAMESTGIYWKPIFHIWNEMGIKITLVNAHHLKRVPGRKTDASDSAWIAELHQKGLLKSSYIPDETFQELRALTRHRTTLVNANSPIKNRVQKILEDGNVKLSSVLSDVFGVAGTEVIKGIISGEDDPDKLVELIKTNVKETKETIRKSLVHTLKPYHRLLIKQLYQDYLFRSQLIFEIEYEIDEKMKPFETQIKLLDTIPGVDKVTAQIIIAEATTETKNFENERIFASWAGVVPGNNESGGKKKDQNVDMEIPL